MTKRIDRDEVQRLDEHIRGAISIPLKTLADEALLRSDDDDRAVWRQG